LSGVESSHSGFHLLLRNFCPAGQKEKLAEQPNFLPLVLHKWSKSFLSRLFLVLLYKYYTLSWASARAARKGPLFDLCGREKKKKKKKTDIFFVICEDIDFASLVLTKKKKKKKETP
jgi:hypothetical protein